MNPHFRKQSSDSGELPTTVYARVDSVEEDEGRVVIGLDAVSAKSADPLLALRSPAEWEQMWRNLASSRRDATDTLSPFDNLELLHLQVTAHPKDAQRLLGTSDASAPWLQLFLGRSGSGGLPGTAYPGLFAPGQPTAIRTEGPPNATTSALLDAAFSLQDWPQTDPRQLSQYLASAYPSVWHAFDVGQGSANGFVGDGPVTLFHDLGCGVYANAKTCPAHLILCHTTAAPVVLSHWDTDHWAGACRFAPASNPTAFLERTWIVPSDPTIGPTHIAFAASILLAGGSLVVLSPGPWNSPWVSLPKQRRLRLLRGSGSDRNGSGMALEIEEDRKRRWLVTGDVEYQYLAPHLATDYVAMSVPHHGAKVKNPLAIPSPGPGYARLIYSFGHDNHFGHPNATSLAAHATQGWDHGHWVLHPDASVVAQGHVLASACNPSGQAHLGSIAVGWNSSPTLTGQVACNGQCTVYPTQC